MKFEHLQGKRHEKIMIRYIKQLELLSLQSGVHPNELEFVLKRIVDGCQKNNCIHRIDVYRTAVGILENQIPSETKDRLLKEGRKLFLYEEDENFHRSIINLSDNIKIPYILTVFHDFTIPEIGDLLNKTEESINHSIEEAERQLLTEIPMQPQQYEKALEFIKKTYSRLPNLADSQRLFSHEPITEDRPLPAREEKKEKSTYIMQIVGASLTVIFFISLFFYSSTNNGRIDEPYIAGLEDEMQIAMNERRKQLAISQTVFEQQPFVLTARNELSELRIEMKKSIDSGEPMKRTIAKQKLAEVIALLKLPSEMVEDLKDDPLTEDADASLDFVDEYAKRLQQVRHAYYMESDPFSRREELPANMVKAMKEQNYFLIHDEDFFAIEYKKSEITNRLEKFLHPSVKPYIEMLTLEQSIYAPGSLTPTDLVEVVGVLEQIMLTEPQMNDLYTTAEMLYNQVYFSLTYGPLIYEKDMTIKQDYRESWEKLAEDKETSPIGALLAIILSEMEVTDWKFSQTLRTGGTFSYLNQAVSLAQQGKLSNLSMEPREVEGFEQHASIQLPNEEFMMEIRQFNEEIESYSGNEGRVMTETQNDPLLVVGTYDAALREENWRVLWQLTPYYYSFDQFNEYFTLEEPILNEVDSIVFDPEWIHTYHNIAAPILFVKDGKTEIGVWVSKLGSGWIVEDVDYMQ